MSDIPLKRLRELREAATVLLREVVPDLRPFEKADGTFRRLPDSRDVANNVGVTTTCSCLMALAATDSFRDFYAKGSRKASIEEAHDKVQSIFKMLVAAPWMSSGLADNNAFTTTLVLRAYGFLREENLLSTEPSDLDQSKFIRPWENILEIASPTAFARQLCSRADPTAEFIWLSLSDSTRDGIDRAVAGASEVDTELLRKLTLDLREIIESGWIYAAGRFDKVSEETKASLSKAQTRYDLATANRRLLSDQYPGSIPAPTTCGLHRIAEIMSKSHENFAINSYPPSAAVVYWFVDGISRAKIGLPGDNWRALCLSATSEFNRKRSLVAARHDAMMDPVDMGMAACLCARLRTLSDSSDLGTQSEFSALLPSRFELDHAIGDLVRDQTKSGIWHKYFPLFHYQDAGSNFCFSFELLEGLLCEFGDAAKSALMADDSFIGALEKAVAWCRTNRAPCSDRSTTYTGWNSGGQLKTLAKGQPESWATAVVHMFLWELQSKLSMRIQEQLLKKYRTRIPPAGKSEEGSKSAVSAMLDIEIVLQGQPQPLSEILTERIIVKHRGNTEAELRRNPSKEPRSALLFGPPGTSKTEVTRAAADDMKWPLVEITPSDFVKGKLEDVYLHANEIFEDLMDLSGVVVFFDEMDALVQTRDGDFHLDITSQFLTTMMLPKLAQLHDQGRVVFFMATNFQDRFDPAIKRAGRFDLLLCMGPPTLDEKFKRLHVVFGEEQSKESISAGELMSQFLRRSPLLLDKLELFTFGDLKSFIKKIGRNATTFYSELQKLDGPEFRKRLKEASNYVGLRMEDLDILAEAGLTPKSKRLTDAYELNISLKAIEKKELQLNNVIRYLHDRKQSRAQH